MSRPCKADVTAAERLLKAAVREARTAIRGWRPARPMPGYDIGATFTPYARDAVVQMLAEATRSADLLLVDSEVSREPRRR